MAETWKITGTTATYFDANGKQVAKLTGLKSGLADNALDSVVGTADATGVSTITLDDSLLGTSKVSLALSNNGKFKLALDSGVTKPILAVTDKTVASGKITLKGTVTEGWVQTNDKILTKVATKTTAVTLATISGLNKNLKLGTNTDPSGAEGKIGVVTETTSSTGAEATTTKTFTEGVSISGTSVTLKEASRGTAKITLSSNYGYTLALEGAINDVVGGVAGSAYWAVSGTTATYKQDTSAKFVLAADAKSVAYTKGSTATIATIKGLSKDLKDSLTNGSIIGIDVTAPTTDSAKGEIKLSKNVLATTGTATLTLGTAYKDKYELAINTTENDAGKVPTDSVPKNIWVVNGGTATYKKVNTAKYTLDGNKVTCTPQTAGEVLATVSGLKNGLIAKDDGLYADISGTSTKVIEAQDAVEAGPTDQNSQTQAAVPAKIKILNANALNNKTVSLNNASTYEIDVTGATGIKEPDGGTDTDSWEVKGTTATLKKNLSAGYTLSQNGKKLTYSAAKNNATIVTINGIKKVINGNDSDIKNAFSLNEANGEITVKKAALGTSTISVTSGNKDKTYTLAFDSDDITSVELTGEIKAYSAGNYSSAEIEGGKDVWRLSGTTATYKKVIPEHYTVEDGKIVYHKETDVANGTIAKITGLKSGLVAKDDGIYASADDTTALVEIGTDNKYVAADDSTTPVTAETIGKITVREDAFGKGTMQLSDGTNATNAKYNLVFDSDEESQGLGPKLEQNATPTWSVSGTTATLKGKITEGYVLDSVNDKITYKPAQQNGVILTVENLKSGLKASDLNKTTEADQIISYADSDKTVTLYNGVLGTDATKDIEIKSSLGNDYELALDGSVITATDQRVTVGTDIWSEDDTTGGTYVYQNRKSDYYAYAKKDDGNGDTTDDKTKIKYTAAVLGKAIVTIAGLSSGLNIITDTADNNYGKIGTETPTTFNELVVVGTDKVTINEGAFKGGDTASDVILTNVNGQNYKIALGKKADNNTDELEAATVKLAPEFDDDGALIINKVTTAGYKVDDVADSQTKDLKITYTPDSEVEIAKVTGLAEGLEVGTTGGELGEIGYYDAQNNWVEVLTIGEAADTPRKITIKSKAALGKDDVTITDGANMDAADKYTFETLGAGYNVADVVADTKGWLVEGTKAYLVAGTTTAGYALEGDKKIKYTAAGFASKDAAIAILDGLKDGTEADVNGNLSGVALTKAYKPEVEEVMADSENNIEAVADKDEEIGVITLSDDSIFGDNDIKVTGGTNGEKYTLALESSVVDNVAPKTKGVWTFNAKSGTATHTQNTSKGWTDSGSDTITFTPEGAVITNISGLTTATTATKDVGIIRVGTADDTGLNGKLMLVTKDATTGDNVKSEAITFYEETGTFVLNTKAAFANKDITLRTENGYDYKLELPETEAAVAEQAIWKKGTNDTKATYTQAVKAGHTQLNDTTVKYYSKDSTITLATVNGLKKGIAADEGIIEGVEVTTDDEGNDVIRLDKSILAKSDVTIAKNDKYNIALNGTEDDYAVADDPAHFVYDASTGKAVLLDDGQREGWAFKQIKGATTPDLDDDEYDYKTLVYKGAVHDTLATVNGLAKNLDVDDDGNLLEAADALDFIKPTTDTEGTIIIGKGVIDKNSTGKITLTNGKIGRTAVKSVFIFNPADEENIMPTSFEKGKKKWSADGKGTLKYQYEVSAGRTISADGRTINYVKPTTEVIATIKGVSTSLNTWEDGKNAAGKTVKVDNPLKDMTGIEVTAPDFDEDGNPIDNTGTIKITDNSVFAEKDVTITSKKYNIDVDKELNPQDFEAPKWYYGSGAGTATLKTGKEAGYTAKDEEANKTIKYYEEDPKTTLVTVTGLSKDLKIGGKSDIAINSSGVGDTVSAAGKLGYIEKNAKVTLGSGTDTVVVKDVFHEVDDIGFEEPNGGELTLPAEFFRNGTTDIKLTNGKDADGNDCTFTFANIKAPAQGDEWDEFKRNPVADTPVWSGSKGTLSLVQHTSAGYTLNDSGSVFAYSKEKPASTVVAKITGLNASLRASTTNDLDATGDGTAKMTVAGALGYIAKKTFGTSTTQKDAFFTYSSEGEPIVFDKDNKTITLKEAALAGKNVAIDTRTNDGYSFVLDSGVPNYAVNATEWVVNGTTAVYKNYDKEFYTYGTKTVDGETVEDATAIKYTKPNDIETYLTVTGLKSGLALGTEGDSTNLYQGTEATEAAVTFDENGKKVVVSADALGTAKVSLKGGEGYTDYTLAFAGGFATNENATLRGTAADPVGKLATLITAKTENTSLGWQKANSSGTASLKGAITAGYTLANDGKSISYAASPTLNKIVAQVTGLKSGATVTDNHGTITLKGDNLNSKNVAVTTSLGDTDYKLTLDGGVAVPTPTISEDLPWTISGGVATLLGSATEGYTLAKSEKSVTYTAELEGVKALATVNGLEAGAVLSKATNVDTTTKTVKLTSTELGDHNVTVGSSYYTFAFDKTYKDASITGSANSDNISVAGDGLNVNAGKGDDYVDLGASRTSENGNTFYYANGDGHDVIADFTDKDTIKIKDVAITEDNITKDGNAVVIKVGTGSITLDNFASSTKINIIDKSSNSPKAYDVSASNPLIADDNYIAPTQDLSAIVSNRIGQIYSGENFASQDITSLAKQSEVIAYSDKK